MSPERKAFHEFRTLPARLTMNETAWYLGFEPSQIPMIVAERLLKPLGHPAKSGSKYFALCVLAELRNDPNWLAKASDATVNYWAAKNSSRRVKRLKQPVLDPAV